MQASTVQWNANPRALAIQFSLVAVIVGLAIGIIVYAHNRERASLIQEGQANLRQQAISLNQQMVRHFEPLLFAGTMLRDIVRQMHGKDDPFSLFIPVAGALLERTPMLSRIYVGFPNGAFYAVERTTIAAAAGTRESIRLIDRGPVGHIESPPPDDPRRQVWFERVMAANQPIWLPPHPAGAPAEATVTYAVPLHDTLGWIDAVVGFDIPFAALNSLIQTDTDALRGKIFIANRDGELLWHPALARRLQGNLTSSLKVAELNDGDATLMYAELSDSASARRIERQRGGPLIAAMSPPAGWPFSIYIGLPEATVVAPANELLQRNLGIALILTLGLIVGVIYTARLSSEVAARRQTEVELRVARDQAEQATEAKSTFLATMSHEIRTPMNGVMSMAEMLELTPLDADQHRMARVIRDSTESLLTVINDILDFSKIEAGKLDIERIPFSLAELIGGVGELLAAKADNAGLEFVLDIDPMIPDQRLGDPTRIRQILLNLGSNAVKFTAAGQVVIRLVAGNGGDHLRFEVEDTGIGLTRAQLDKLFQPFVQADSSTARKFGGTGLGLSICHRLCQIMDGHIGATSEPGKRTIFWFELPLPPAEATPARLRPQEPISRCRVLLLGLPPVQSAVARRYLTAGEISDIAVASSHAEAIALGRKDFDLILVDPRCPDLPSLQLANQLGTTACYAVIAPRNLISTLDAAQRTHFRIALMYPILYPILWRAAAVALGLVSATKFQIQNVERDDMAFSPPPLEEARDAGAVVLVAEDNKTNQTVIAQMLSRLGFACEIAENGTEALALYGKSRYGLLLTDFHMPEMDGFELTRHVRDVEARAGGPRMPIVALTADALPGIRQRCIEAGMDEYLTKPINSRHLGEALGRLLPAALDLRRPASSSRSAAPPAAAEALDWDSDIFDPQQLRSSFGSFDAKVKDLLREFAADTAEKIPGIEQAASAGDIAEIRRQAHALKGAARSIGAHRLGQVAADLQDACDAGDADMVKIMAGLLAPTYSELQGLMPKILEL